ncbi:MAG: PASTA domain-containing protein [Faecalibacterium sp.]|jgi:serine/threonine-protein kinase|nr:PASTA domain-containing protein [Faecalibacterium sp.]
MAEHAAKKQTGRAGEKAAGKRLCPHCLGQMDAGAAACPHCHHSMENTNPRGMLPYGSILAGRYTVGEFCAADGEGILYHAVENSAAVRVTIKEYLPVTLAEDRGENGTINPKPGSEVLYKTTRMDFADLYHELMKITPATGLEAVLDVLETNNTAYAVMENPGGVPLTEALKQNRGRIDPAEARSMLQPVFEGVAAMHKAGLVHRGISPENIRVLDSGKARLAGYATVGLRTVGGALRPQLYEGYSAPEQYSSAEFEGRYTDEYALAAVFYRMVTGQAPLSAAQRLVADSNPSARSLDASIPGWLSDVLAHGMNLKPAGRIQTVPVLMSSLTSPTAAQAIVGETRREKRHKQKLTGMLAALLVLVAALVCLALFWILGRGGGKNDLPASSQAPSSQASEAEYVPDFVGMTYAQIQASGQYAGHFRFKLEEAYDATVEKGIILSQTPEAGATVSSEDDRTITLTVSNGPESVEVPNVVGFTQDSAVQEIQSAGLTASCVMMTNDGTYASGCVIKTDPLGGTEVAPATTITVYIAADRDVQIDASVSGADDPNNMEGFD